MRIDKNFITGFAVAALASAIGGYIANPTPVAGSAASSHYFVKRDSAEKHQVRTTVSRVMLTADMTNGRYSIIDEEFGPEMASFGHRHTFHSETFLIVSGRMEWTVGGETETLGAGDLVYIPPDVPHKTRVIDGKTVHAIMIYEPAGYELNLRRRVSQTPEQREDPEHRRRMMELSDVVPLTAAGRDF